MLYLEKREIQQLLYAQNVIPAIEQGFVAYSEGKAVVPPVGELLFTDPPGDVHIKYGYLKGDRYYVVKIASGFYQNARFGLPANNGVVLLFDRQTGEPLSILYDQGYLTDLRTGIAGALAAQYLAPTPIHRIGIIGTGTQARMQLRNLVHVTPCRDVLVLGRAQEKLNLYQQDMEQEGFCVDTTSSSEEISHTCNLIVTTTPSTTPLLFAQQIQPGTHITAVGSDTPSKQELDSSILQKADLVVADSITQCHERGEISHALKEQRIKEENILELGFVITGKAPRRTSAQQITVADLTGVAVQDIQIVKAIYELACHSTQ